MRRRKTNSRKKTAAQNTPSRHARKRNSRTQKPPLRYSSLNARQRSTYDRATSLLTDLRAGRGSYSHLLLKYHLASRTARDYLGHDLLGGTRGKPVRTSKSDRRVRDVHFPTALGDVPFRTRSSRDATKLSEFFNDRYKLLDRRLSVEDFEAKWQGMHIARKELFADTSAILDMANADVLNVQDLYASTTNSR